MSSVPDGFKEDYGPPVTARVPVFIKKVPVPALQTIQEKYLTPTKSPDPNYRSRQRGFKVSESGLRVMLISRLQEVSLFLRCKPKRTTMRFSGVM